MLNKYLVLYFKNDGLESQETYLFAESYPEPPLAGINEDWPRDKDGTYQTMAIMFDQSMNPYVVEEMPAGMDWMPALRAMDEELWSYDAWASVREFATEIADARRVHDGEKWGFA